MVFGWTWSNRSQLFFSSGELLGQLENHGCKSEVIAQHFEYKIIRASLFLLFLFSTSLFSSPFSYICVFKYEVCLCPQFHCFIYFFQVHICDSPVIIKKEEEYILRIDSEDITSSMTLTRAIMCYVASFYVFNLSYPKLCRKFLSFIQRVILKISDSEQVDKSVLLLNEKIYNKTTTSINWIFKMMPFFVL